MSYTSNLDWISLILATSSEFTFSLSSRSSLSSSLSSFTSIIVFLNSVHLFWSSSMSFLSSSSSSSSSYWISASTNYGFFSFGGTFIRCISKKSLSLAFFMVLISFLRLSNSSSVSLFSPFNYSTKCFWFSKSCNRSFKSVIKFINYK